jgi:hypothetical protein
MMDVIDQDRLETWLQKRYDAAKDKATDWRTSGKDLPRYQAEARILQEVMQKITAFKEHE